MKKIISILFLAIMALGCSKEEQTPNTALQNADSFNVSVEQTGTKTTVNEYYQIIWSEGDKISVFPTTESNHEYSYGGFEESTSAKFYKTSEDQETGTPLNAFYGIYPYNASTSVSANGKITLTLPAEQQYAYNSFAPGTNTMVAVSSGTNDKNLAFKSICGFIRIRLYGNAIISSIELKGNKGETIAGTATITASNSSDPAVQMADGNNAGTAITLKCPDEGIAIGAIKDKATSFWFAVPPVTFEEGFTITVETTEGTIRTKTTEKQYTVNRNELKTMEAVLISEDQPNNEIWYTTTDGNPIQLGSTDGFGSTFVEHTYANGKGKIKFAGDVTDIPSTAFQSNSSLQSIALPKSITSIGASAFYSCKSLTGTIEIPEGVKSIPYNVFYDCSKITKIILNNNITSIGSFCFYNCSELSEINIPSSLTSIGENAFFSCKSLTGTIEIPEGVTSIPESVFSGCSSISKIILHDNITSIGSSAFSYCSKLTEINIPKNLTSFGAFAFRECLNLSSAIVIPSGVTIIPESLFHYCSKIPEIVLHEGITSLGISCFSGCSEISEIDLPDGITEIPEGTFHACKKIASIVIPENVTSIGENSFKLTGLTEITIPAKVNSIIEGAFYGCDNLANIYCKSTVPPKLIPDYGDSFVFYPFSNNADNRIIHVPVGSADVYKTADFWEKYANAIVGDIQ